MVSQRFLRYGHRVFPSDVVDTTGRVGGCLGVRVARSCGDGT